MKVVHRLSMAVALLLQPGLSPAWGAAECAPQAVAIPAPPAPATTFETLKEQAVGSARSLLQCMLAKIGAIPSPGEEERAQLRQTLQAIHDEWVNSPPPGQAPDEDTMMPDEATSKIPLHSIPSSGDLPADVARLNRSLLQLAELLQLGLAEGQFTASAIGLINAPPPSAGAMNPNSLRVPDPNLQFYVPASQRLSDGRPIPPPNASHAERARQLVADQFERLVRIFMAGTEQLKRDFPPQAGTAPYSGPEIRGYYQGYLPDVLGTLATGQELSGQYDAKAAACGVANPQNRWFKGDGGSLAETVGSGRVTNHRPTCRNVTLNEPVDFLRGRGRIAHRLMTLMESVKESIIRGYVPEPGAFGASNAACRERRDRIGVQALVPGARREVLENDPLTLASAANRRHYNYLVYTDLLREFKRDEVQQNLLQCAEQAGRTGRQQADDMASSLSRKTLHRQQNRVCLLAAMQTIVETQLVAEYAYCVWRAAAQKNIEEITRALIPPSANAGRPDPWLANACTEGSAG